MCTTLAVLSSPASAVGFSSPRMHHLPCTRHSAALCHNGSACNHRAKCKCVLDPYALQFPRILFLQPFPMQESLQQSLIFADEAERCRSDLAKQVHNYKIRLNQLDNEVRNHI